MLRFLPMLLTLLFLIPLKQADAQLLNDRFDFDSDIEYSAAITSPENFLGYPLGEEYSHHHQLGAYLKTWLKRANA